MFLENFQQFALSDVKDNTLQPLNRRGIADFTLLRTLLAICLMLCEPTFWKEIRSLILLA